MDHTHNNNHQEPAAIAFASRIKRMSAVAALTVVLALTGCGKPAAKPPEKSLVRIAVVQSADNRL